VRVAALAVVARLHPPKGKSSPATGGKVARLQGETILSGRLRGVRRRVLRS
jgi:hypothetical protein